jgi:thiol-disulfide isomerase/thioredoxin
MDGNLFRRRQLLLYFGLGVVGVSAAAAALPRSRTPSTSSLLPSRSTGQNPNQVAALPPAGNPLPEFQGISTWLNSSPLSVSDLKGSVVLVQFWTFACINCQRTLPYVVQWHRQYAAQGLKVVGIHTPEFAFERDVNNIKRALQQHQISYPVPVDTEYKTWNAYGNNYWPHLYLADRQGRLRYDHVGEGAYDETEQTIRQLLGA